MNQRSSPFERTQVFDDRREVQSPNRFTSQSPGQPILWIDGVGGFLMLDKDDLLIGQAVASRPVDIGIVGDLSRQAAVLKRRQSDYILEPVQDTLVDGHRIEGPHLLRSGEVLQWGARIRLRFVRSHPLSSTARLDMQSLHRFQPRVDGVLLLADSCILGPSPSNHVVCPAWSQNLLMFKSGDQWLFRTNGEVEIDGCSQQGEIPLARGMRVRGADFSLSVE